MAATEPMRSLRLLLASASLSVCTPAASAAWGMPEPLTPRGETIADLYGAIFIAAIVVFVVVMALMAWVIVRYRESSGHGRATFERSRHHTGAEVTWTVIPLGIMLWIGVISYFGLLELDNGIAPGEEEMEVQIVGSQWNWQARYEGGVSIAADPDPSTGAVANVFKIPADTDVLLNITSGDVIHAWYMADANRAPVGLIDANPSGPHKYNHMALNLPAGDYFVQCREMCFNPGHAYMRAQVEAVSSGDFDLWLRQQQAGVGSEIVEQIDVNLTAAGLDLADNITGVAESRYVLTIHNQIGDEVQVEVGAENTTIPAGAKGVVAVDMPSEGDYTLIVRGREGVLAERMFTAVEATIREVDMADFVFEPGVLEVTAGETYLVRVTNTHNTAHNLFIGPSFGQEPVARSPTVGPGGSGAFLYQPTESGVLEMWCNVPGHYSLGMHGDVQIA